MNRKWEAKLKQIEERASHYERKPLSSVYRPRLSKPEEPPSIWKLFHRQTQAFNFARSCKEDVHVFALECKVGDGQRIYLVTTYVELWFYYKSSPNYHLHIKKLLKKGIICTYYEHLNFNKPPLSVRMKVDLAALIMNHVCKALQELYSVNCSAEDVLNLDSSTDEKFSRHLIFQLRDVAFKDNIHVGNFVRKIFQPACHLIARENDSGLQEATGHECPHVSEAPVKQGISTDSDMGGNWPFNPGRLERLGSAEQSTPDLSFLVVKNNMGEKHLFVDLGVYTRNRNFRLYKSSKIGKRVALEVAEDNRFFPLQPKCLSKEYQYFLASLVSNVRFSDSLKILTCDIFQDKRKRIEYSNGISTSSTSVGTMEGFQCSPYPEVDHFVLSLVNKNGITGGIRHWNYFFPEELLVYDICKYRWCANIGRAHKSNNIIQRILVDLKSEVWYQKCHDPVCKAENFRSDCSPLPAEVCLQFLFREEEEFPTDDADNSRTKTPHQQSPHELSADVSSDTGWDDDTDDVCLLEATEDAELVDAAENSLLSYSSTVDEIPDELIIAVLQD
uniref:DNA-directed primase/polymerase protein n=1 Tax=Otolemur garnettii TaxID=30611 RepID=H0WJ54_OTOGA